MTYRSLLRMRLNETACMDKCLLKQNKKRFRQFFPDMKKMQQYVPYKTVYRPITHCDICVVSADL